MNKRITIIGGGNIGTLMAADFSARGNEVTVYTRDESRWTNHISVYDREDNFLFDTEIARITESLEEAIIDAEIVWITTPSQTFEDYAERLEPLVRVDQTICVVPGSGAEVAFANIIAKGCKFVGLEKVHGIARLKEYGKSVYSLGKKELLHVGVVPASSRFECAKMVWETLGIETVAHPNYLCVALTNVNAFLHTTRLVSMFGENAKDKVYDRKPYFYKEWDDASSKMIFDCDAELKSLLEEIPLHLESVELLHDFYKSETVEQLTETLATLPSFQTIMTPMIEVEGGYTVDWNNRYFKADFPYGLKLLLDYARAFNIETPTMEKIWEWYISKDKDAKGFEFNFTKEDIISIYR